MWQKCQRKGHLQQHNEQSELTAACLTKDSPKYMHVYTSCVQKYASYLLCQFIKLLQGGSFVQRLILVGTKDLWKMSASLFVEKRTGIIPKQRWPEQLETRVQTLCKAEKIVHTCYKAKRLFQIWQWCDGVDPDSKWIPLTVQTHQTFQW